MGDKLDEFGRRLRGGSRDRASSSPPPPSNRRRARSPSPASEPSRYQRSSSPHKRRRFSRSPPPRRFGGGDGRGRSPGGRLGGARDQVNWGIASVLRDCGYVLPLREFEEKLASKYAARELSPESKRTTVEKDYAQYVEAYKSDVRGPGGEAMRFFTHHSDEQWFWERYHPEGQALLANVRAEETRGHMEQCLKELDLQTLKPIGFVMQAVGDAGVKMAEKRVEPRGGERESVPGGAGSAGEKGGEANGQDPDGAQGEEGAAADRTDEVEDDGAGERGGEVCTGQSSTGAEVGRGGEEAGEDGVAAWCREEATSAKQVPDCQTLREWWPVTD